MGVFDLGPDDLLSPADEEILSTFFGVLNGDGWQECSKDADGCVVSWKQDPERPNILVKGVVPVSASIRQVCDFMIDDNDPERAQATFRQLDSMCKTIEFIEVIDAKHVIKYATYAMPPPLWPRDFVWKELHTRRPDGAYVSIGVSMEHPSRPPTTGKWVNEVRAEITVSGYWIEPTGEDSCIAHYLMQCDPKGMIPPAVVNLCCTNQGLNVKRLKTAVEKPKK